MTDQNWNDILKSIRSDASQPNTKGKGNPPSFGTEIIQENDQSIQFPTVIDKFGVTTELSTKKNKDKE